jgi:hypothetical protein
MFPLTAQPLEQTHSEMTRLCLQRLVSSLKIKHIYTIYYASQIPPFLKIPHNLRIAGEWEENLSPAWGPVVLPVIHMATTM